MPKSSSSYKITLGDNVLNRAKIIFAIVSVIVLLILGATVYAESQTNNLKNMLAQPFKNLANSIGEAFKEISKTPSTNTFEITSVTVSTSSSDVIINNTPVPQTSKKTYTTTTKTTAPQPTKSIQEINAAADKAYQDALKKQEEWAAQQRAANDAWFQQQSAKNAQASQDWFNQKVQEQQQSLDAWKKANGF